jgi:SpoVK/Ycf46/Vps4 family AAA+-type ATPase
MEQHEGVTVLATNRFRDLDEAFRRRFHFILDLPMPDAPSRLRIWQGMLPSEVELSRDHDLDKLAKTFELSGGEIRNCVLTAAYLAADRQQPLSNEHFAYAIRRELTKNGRLVDESIFSVLKRSST